MVVHTGHRASIIYAHEYDGDIDQQSSQNYRVIYSRARHLNIPKNEIYRSNIYGWISIAVSRAFPTDRAPKNTCFSEPVRKVQEVAIGVDLKVMLPDASRFLIKFFFKLNSLNTHHSKPYRC